MFFLALIPVLVKGVAIVAGVAAAAGAASAVVGGVKNVEADDVEGGARRNYGRKKARLDGKLKELRAESEGLGKLKVDVFLGELKEYHNLLLGLDEKTRLKMCAYNATLSASELEGLGSLIEASETLSEAAASALAAGTLCSFGVYGANMVAGSILGGKAAAAAAGVAAGVIGAKAGLAAAGALGTGTGVATAATVAGLKLGATGATAAGVGGAALGVALPLIAGPAILVGGISYMLAADERLEAARAYAHKADKQAAKLEKRLIVLDGLSTRIAELTDAIGHARRTFNALPAGTRRNASTLKWKLMAGRHLHELLNVTLVSQSGDIVIDADNTIRIILDGVMGLARHTSAPRRTGTARARKTNA